MVFFGYRDGSLHLGADLEQQVRRHAPEAVSDAIEGATNGALFVASQQLFVTQVRGDLNWRIVGATTPESALPLNGCTQGSGS
ncbi:MAG: hypothetical protein ABI469_11580 [Gemmatimonadales bacterium]